MTDDLPGRKGGKARAQNLTPERRREIAVDGAKKRWKLAELAMPNAVAQGPLEIGDVELRCFVLDDERRVISGRTMTTAIGMRGRGQGVTRIIANRRISDLFSNELRVAIENPILFNGSTSRKTNPTHGYEGSILQDICESILQARDDGRLRTEQEQRYAVAAEALIRAFAREGIRSLIDRATGYQDLSDKTRLHAILKAYVSPTLLPWTEKYPVEFFEEMFRLYKWKWPASEGAYKGPLGPRYAGKLLNILIYDNLPPGVRAELDRLNPPDAKYQRRQRMPQLLTGHIGHPHVEKLVAVVTALFKISRTKEEFWRFFEANFPKSGQQLRLDFDQAERDPTKLII